MKQPTTGRLTALVGTMVVAVLALSGAALAATTPLAVTKTVPAGGATEVARTANLKAYINHDMKASTITSSTFKIRKQGTTTWLGATRAVNNTISPTSTNGGSQSVLTLDPDANLASNTIYQVVVVSGSSGVKDLNGNALGANKSWTFTTVMPPETTIDPNTGPTGTVASDSASFAFSSSKQNSTFKCSLDGSSFAACASPKDYPGPLSQGSHTFRVRAIDASGVQDPFPASRNWSVDTIVPAAPAITSPQENGFVGASFTLSGTTEPNATVEVFEGTTSKGTTNANGSGVWSKALSGVSEGTHTYTAKATDAADNTSSASNTRSLTVDTTAPDTTIDSGPSGAVSSSSASFTFSSSEANARFECSLDSSPFGACPSPVGEPQKADYSGLSDGSHTFRVRAIDAAGNIDPNAPSRPWTVDTVGPNATITDGPPSLSNSLSATFTFSGAESGGGYECKVDAAGSPGTFAACTSGQSFAVQSPGTFTFSVRASDVLGNFGTSDSHSWTVDTVAPTVGSVSPVDGATGVSPTSNVAATFSEAMNASTVSGQSFTLSKAGSPVSAQVTYDQNSRTATLDPAGDLQTGATYDAKITTSVKDTAGNALVQEKTWSFTVASPPPGVTVTPNPLNFTPASSGCNVTITKTVTITNNTASQVDLIPSVTNAHYSVAGDVLHIASGESLNLSVSWTAPNSGFRIADPGRLDLKDAAGNIVATGNLTAFINCGIEG